MSSKNTICIWYDSDAVGAANFYAATFPDSAVKAMKGNLSDKAAVSVALKKADFTSLRGDFKFNVNGYPIQNFYLTKVARRPDGKFQTEIVEKVFENYGDRYARDCTPGK